MQTINCIIKKVLTKIDIKKISTDFPNPKFDLTNHEKWGKD